MTANQINYQNMVVEQQKVYETGRHNKELEAIQSRQQQEEARHNLITEAVSRSSLNESIRHNIMSEEFAGLQSRASLISAGAAQTGASASMLQASVADYLSTLQAKRVPAEVARLYSETDVNKAKVGLTGAQTLKTKREANVVYAETAIRGVNAASNLLGTVSQALTNRAKRFETGVNILKGFALAKAK